MGWTGEILDGLKQAELRDCLDVKDYGAKGIKEMTPRILLCKTGWTVVLPAKEQKKKKQKTKQKTKTKKTPVNTKGSLINQVMITTSSNTEVLQISIIFLLPQF